jgi:hypothetical protein
MPAHPNDSRPPIHPSIHTPSHAPLHPSIHPPVFAGSSSPSTSYTSAMPSFGGGTSSTGSGGTSSFLGGGSFSGGGGGGSSSYSVRYVYYRAVDLFFSFVRKTLWLFFVVAALYGAYDSFKYQTAVVVSGQNTAAAIFGVSDGLGEKIRQTWPTSSATPVVNGVRVVITWGLAIDAGIGAGVGNGTIWAGREVLGYLARLGGPG